MPGSTVKVRRRLKDGSVKTYTYERRKKRLPPGPDSLAWLVREYTKSPDFTKLKPQSQRVYRAALRYVEPIRMLPMAQVQRKHLLKIRDRLSDRPALANLFIAVLGAVYRFALERGYREDFNPADSIRPLQIGRGEPWPAEAIEAAEARLTGPLRLAFMLGLYTGQRRGDVLAMTWGAYKGGRIVLVQEKTAAPLSIPVAPALAAELAAAPKDRIRIVGLSPSQFAAQWPRAMEALGFPKLAFHGLRHTAATRLAEAGCSDHEIQSITGHASLASVQRYTRAARQQMLSGQAMARVYDFPGAKEKKAQATD